jgi:NAD(P)H-dependent flavin oxidoreductase YrpB (nitropropane dioxygenase family)
MTTSTLTQYPLACMAMNRVSDLKLAQAVRRAGALPSLSLFNYYKFTASKVSQLPTDQLEKEVDATRLAADLTAYQAEFNDLNILISTGIKEFVAPAVFEILSNQLPAIIEVIVEDSDTHLLSELFEKIKQLRSRGCLFFKKTLGVGDIHHVFEHFDGLVLKGNEGAGTIVGGPGSRSLEENFDAARELFPDKYIIPNGGVGTPEQVKYYLDRGAYLVGIGTLFAAAEESSVSVEAKNKMIAASANDLKSTSKGQYQQGLMFSTVEETSANNTRGLVIGLKTGTHGHILAGKGIDNVTAILPASEIVKNLVTLI